MKHESHASESDTQMLVTFFFKTALLMLTIHIAVKCDSQCLSSLCNLLTYLVGRFRQKLVSQFDVKQAPVDVWSLRCPFPFLGGDSLFLPTHSVFPALVEICDCWNTKVAFYWLYLWVVSYSGIWLMFLIWMDFTLGPLRIRSKRQIMLAETGRLPHSLL